ncbi:uncharacterized protein LOC144476732 isoform X1 [Augochlora pura]
MQLETVGPLGWNVSKMLGQYCRGTWGARTIPQVDCGFLCIVDTVYICCDNRVSLDNSFFLLIMTAAISNGFEAAGMVWIAGSVRVATACLRDVAFSGHGARTLTSANADYNRRRGSAKSKRYAPGAIGKFCDGASFVHGDTSARLQSRIQSRRSLKGQEDSILV